jgi:hypothetical protein
MTASRRTLTASFFFSPEQHEALLKPREEQQQNLSREQWEVVLKALEERQRTQERP